MRRLLIGMMLAVVCVCTAQAQTTGNSPAIQVTPETVEVGDTIEVTGTGFTAGDTVSATLGNPETDFAGLAMAHAQVAEDGTFTLSFTMPQNWPCCIVATPITEHDLLVVITRDSQTIASAPITYDLGWREQYNPTFDFSVMVPPDWTFGESEVGFDFIMPGMETLVPVVVLTAQAVPQDINDEVMSLEEYIQASPEQGIQLEGVAEISIGNLTSVTTASGEEGFVASWTAENENGEIVASGKSAYFEISELQDDTFYRTVQITSSDPAALMYFDAIVDSFTRGPQQTSICATTTELASDGVMDTQRLIQELCSFGAVVTFGEDFPEINIPIFHAPGQFIIVNGEQMQVYEFPDEASAQAVREDTSADGTIIGSPNVGWETPPHFFGTGKVIVLYVRDDPGLLSLLEQVLGAQVAGRPIPETSDGRTRISWDEARSLILSGEVEFVFQAHSLEVQLNTSDGRRFITTEPRIDEVFVVVGECGDTCLNIGLATE